MAIPSRPAQGRKPIRRGPGKRIVEGKSFRLADEVRYIQRRAADYDGRIVTIGQLVLFSTETGDAWLLDPADRLAARLARDGENEPIHIEAHRAEFDSRSVRPCSNHCSMRRLQSTECHTASSHCTQIAVHR